MLLLTFFQVAKLNCESENIRTNTQISKILEKRLNFLNFEAKSFKEGKRNQKAKITQKYKISKMVTKS